MKNLSKVASRIFPTASLELTLLRDVLEKVERKLSQTKCDSCGHIGLKLHRKASKKQSKIEGKLAVVGACPKCANRQPVPVTLGLSPDA